MNAKYRLKTVFKICLTVFLLIAFAANCKDKASKPQFTINKKPQAVKPMPVKIEKAVEENKEENDKKVINALESESDTTKVDEKIEKPLIKSRIRPLDPPPLPVIPRHELVAAEKKIDSILENIKKDQEDFTKELFELSKLGFAACTKLRNVVKDSKALWKKRWVSVMALGRIGGDYSRFTILEAINDESSLLKMAAAIALKNFKDEEVVDELHRAFLLDKGMLVRNTIVDTLVQIGNPKSIPVLAAGLNSSENYYRGKNLWIRNNIVYAMGKLKNKSAVPHLIDILSKKDSTLYDITLKSLVYIVEPKEESIKDEKTSSDEKIIWWLSWWDKHKSEYL